MSQQVKYSFLIGLLWIALCAGAGGCYPRPAYAPAYYAPVYGGAYYYRGGRRYRRGHRRPPPRRHRVAPGSRPGGRQRGGGSRGGGRRGGRRPAVQVN